MIPDRRPGPVAVEEEDFPMIEVSIPSMEKEVDESGKSRKVREGFGSLLLSAEGHRFTSVSLRVHAFLFGCCAVP